MTGPDTLARLTTELRAMPAREKRAILAALSDAERTRTEALMLGNGPEPGTRSATIERFAGLSPWLAARLRQGQGGEAGQAGRWKMTDATRQMLLQSAQRASEKRSLGTAPPPAGGRSLIGAVAGLLSARRRLP